MVIDPLKDLPGYALRRASWASMSKLAKRLQALDLRPAEASVLMVIDANPGITQSEIGELLNIARANMTPLTMRLSKRKLVARAKVDGRSQGLSLTELGSDLVELVRHSLSEHEAKLMARIPARLHAPFLEAIRMLWSRRDD